MELPLTFASLGARLCSIASVPRRSLARGGMPLCVLQATRALLARPYAGGGDKWPAWEIARRAGRGGARAGGKRKGGEHGREGG